jgi:hypothetical protein
MTSTARHFGTCSSIPRCAERRRQRSLPARSLVGRVAARPAQADTWSVARRVTIFLALAVLLGAVMLLALTARNEYCLPWQERVGYGDGPLGEGQDFSTCR